MHEPLNRCTQQTQLFYSIPYNIYADLDNKNLKKKKRQMIVERVYINKAGFQIYINKYCEINLRRLFLPIPIALILFLP